jgi:4-hydroxy-tetrahydrodipicolinate synthase
MPGTGSNSTAEALRLTVAAERAGADAALVVGPYYNKPTQEGFYQHFRALAEAVGLQICVYNIPGRTGVNLDPETIVRLAEVAPNIQAVKESSGRLPQIADLVRVLPRGFKVFSGDDNLALASIGVGAHGLVSVAANEIPAEMGRISAPHSTATAPRLARSNAATRG